jgi:hypothetical protein
MLPDTRTTCCPHMAHLYGFATCGFQHILHAASAMQTDTDSLPDDLKPYGEALTNIIMEVLSKHYVACLRLISELGMRDITQAALLPEQQIEQESLNRRRSDEI